MVNGIGVFLQLAAYLEARALLHPLPGLHRSVSVQVGAEVAMSAHPHFILEAAQQLCHEQVECRALFRCTGVFRISRSVQSALVTDAYRMLVVALHMRPHKLDGAGVGDGTVTADVVVVADAVEAAAQVVVLQVGHGVGTVLTGGAAMDNQVIDFSQ